MRFDPQLRARTPRLREATKNFEQRLIAEEAQLGLRSRARKADDRRKFNIAVEALACNLLLLGLLDDTAELVVPLDNNMMWGTGRYRNPVYGQHFLSLLALMERLKLIRRITTGFRISKSIKAPSLVEAAPEFREHFPKVTPASFYREQEPEVLILKSGKDAGGDAELLNYPESKRTKTLRRQVHRINDWLLNADIELTGVGPSVRLDKNGEVVATYRRTIRRTFNNKSWQQGGRLAGGFWMTMSRKDRFRRIRLDGHTGLADVDFQQLFPRLAYARAGAPQPMGDLYDVVGDGSGRDGWKKLLNALLFSQGTLMRWPRECSPHFLGMKLRETVAHLERKHQPIVHLFGTRVGFELMYAESEMLIAVISHLFANGITALPLHDAVLVASPNAEAAKVAMEHAFCSYTGQSRAFVKVEFGPLK
ncbi:hypothetical protein [Rhodopseudomonas sp.]|uniref:hypothetical protein n=1 Tax=Rhodopseudomonas sp. TaxID=1078 RepID=UPI003B3B096D